jgi:transposase-like protein
MSLIVAIILGNGMRRSACRKSQRPRQRQRHVSSIICGVPPQHRTKLHSTNPIERVNGESKQRTNVAGIFLNEAAITPSSALFCSNNEWAVQREK